ncbi:MAG: hypothetical protein KGL53_15090, partial [Elusimicrobia bacterium]|nr:hypothetical protein [Elusimicrobiota bacterium]
RRRRPRPGEVFSPSDLDADGFIGREKNGAPVQGSAAELIPYRDCQLHSIERPPGTQVEHIIDLGGPLDAQGRWSRHMFTFAVASSDQEGSTVRFVGFDRTGRPFAKKKVLVRFLPDDKTAQRKVEMSDDEARRTAAAELRYWLAVREGRTPRL